MKVTQARAIAGLVLGGCLASCTSVRPEPPAPAPAAGAASPASGATCAGWHALDTSQHTVIVGSVLETQVGGPEASLRAACLWAISDQIARHVGDLCDAGREYGEASKLAFTTANEFCTEKTRSIPAQ